MIGVNVSADSMRGLSSDVSRAVRLGLLDAADKGFQESQQEAPVGATSGLKMSGVQPVRRGDSIVWGYTAPYAEYVEMGTEPHWPPIDPLLLWARRVLSDEGAGYAVQAKIADEGTDPQPYVRQGVEAMRDHLEQTGLKGFITRERG